MESDQRNASLPFPIQQPMRNEGRLSALQLLPPHRGPRQRNSGSRQREFRGSQARPHADERRQHNDQLELQQRVWIQPYDRGRQRRAPSGFAQLQLRQVEERAILLVHHRRRRPGPQQRSRGSPLGPTAELLQPEIKRQLHRGATSGRGSGRGLPGDHLGPVLLRPLRSRPKQPQGGLRSRNARNRDLEPI